MGDYLWPALGALVGVLARVGSWRRADSSVDWWKAAGDCLTIPAVASIVSAGAAYIDPNMDIRIVTGGSTLVALIGVAAVEAAALKWLNKKAEG